jgi:hypothetical protein
VQYSGHAAVLTESFDETRNFKNRRREALDDCDFPVRPGRSAASALTLQGLEPGLQQQLPDLLAAGTHGGPSRLLELGWKLGAVEHRAAAGTADLEDAAAEGAEAALSSLGELGHAVDADLCAAGFIGAAYGPRSEGAEQAAEPGVTVSTTHDTCPGG